MAVYRQVHVEFWQDGFVLDLTPEEKYFYLYLMTNSKTTQCGIYELPKRIIETETGYARETVDKLLQRFVDYGKILYSEKTKEIMLLNWSRYNFINSPKVKACIEKELKTIKHKPFVINYSELVSKDYGYRIDTLSKDYREEREEEKEKEEEREEEKEEKSPKFQTCDMEMAQQLFSLILENHENAKKPDFDKWADDFRLMRERDKRTEEQLRYLIDWSQSNDFWKGNILSPAKLRKHFDSLAIKVKEEIKKKNKTAQMQDSKPRAYQSLQDWADEA
jgi:hypothetical protein